MSDTFFICPCGCLDATFPELQWACASGHIISRMRRGEKPGKFVFDHEGDLLVVGKAAENPRFPVGEALNRQGSYAVLRHGSRLLDEHGLLPDCPLCGSEVWATLCRCEKCGRPIKSDQIIVHEVQYAPTGIAAANLVLQYDPPVPGGPRWIA